MVDEEEQPEEQPEEEENQVDEAKKAIRELAEQNEIMSKNLDRMERLQTADVLGGSAHAGNPAPTSEEKEIASAKKLIEGSGFEDMLDPIQ